jgi:hypothetical protein
MKACCRCQAAARRWKVLAKRAGTHQQLAVGKLFNHRQRRCATCGVAPEGATQAAGPGSIHDLRAPGDRRQGHAAPKRLGRENEIGLDTEMRTGKKLPSAAETGLHFIGDEDDAAIMTDLHQRGQKSSRRHDKAAFAEHRLNHNGGDGFGGHNTAEGLVEQFGYLALGHRPPVGKPRICRNAEGYAIDIGQERAEPLLVWVRFAGERQAQHGSAVEAIFHAEDRGTAGKGAGNLHCVLHRLRSAVHQEGLLGKLARRELVEFLCQRDVAFVAGHLEAEMEEGVQLRAQRV